MSELHIKGWLGTDYDGMVATSESKDNSSWDSKAIIKQVESFAEENGMTGIGGRKSYIEDVSLRIYFTDKECTLDEAVESLLMFQFSGEVKTDIALRGYSEYTITGYSVEDFSIGGHDLEYEMSNHIGEYINFILEC
jgi:hypothetical protein